MQAEVGLIEQMNSIFSVPYQRMEPVVPWVLSPNPKVSDKVAQDQDKSRVLVVDDNPDVTYSFAIVLEHAGYDVISATSAQAALKAAQREHFDVIVSDIGMPEMDGYELARALRALPDYVATPMIAVTGFEEFAAHEDAFEAGFNAHLKKPIDLPKLLEILARLRH
jgi:two-component system, chemotaxis family, CheB/CheR fusion protein